MCIRDRVYAVFCYIQVRYLFGGIETALLQGGYAQYARSGFFPVSYTHLSATSMAVSRGRPSLRSSRPASQMATRMPVTISTLYHWMGPITVLLLSLIHI